MCYHSPFPSPGVPVLKWTKRVVERQPNGKRVMCIAPHLGIVPEAQTAIWGLLDWCSGCSPATEQWLCRQGKWLRMWWGTKENIWKTPTYLNRLKWVFCSSCQADLPLTSACLEEKRKSFLRGLIQIGKKEKNKTMLCFDFRSLSSEGFIAQSAFFGACLNSPCSWRANSHLEAVYQMAEVLGSLSS